MPALIRAYLRDSGCVLDEAADGLAALEKFKSSKYQLVLTDVEMPGRIDGFALATTFLAMVVLYSVNAISGSTESQGEVTVRLQNSGRVVNGVGADPDIRTVMNPHKLTLWN